MSRFILDTAQEKNLETAYRREDPVRRWRAWRSGEVELVNELSFKSTGTTSPDGAKGEIYLRDEESPFKVLNISASNQISKDPGITMTRGDALYFRLNPGTDERNDVVNWRSRIRYTSIRLFEDMDELPALLPPNSLSLSGFSRLSEEMKKFYTYQDNNGNNGLSGYYLVSDWLENILDADMTEFIQRGWFFPRRLTPGAYKAFVQYLKEQLPDSDNDMQNLYKLTTLDTAEGYYKISVNDRTAGNVPIKNHFQIWYTGLSEEQKKEYNLETPMVYDFGLNKTMRPLPGKSGTRYYDNNADTLDVQAILHKAASELPPGRKDVDNRYGLDLIYDESDTITARLYLTYKPDGSPEVTESPAGSGASPVNLNATLDSDVVEVERDGVKLRYTIKEDFTVPESLPAEDAKRNRYFEELTDRLFPDEKQQIAARSIGEISISEWNELPPNIAMHYIEPVPNCAFGPYTALVA